MSMDLFIARTVITKASLVYRGPLEITELQVDQLFFFIVIDILHTAFHLSA